MLIYADALSSGWDSWSWSGDYDFAATDLVYSGSHAISASASGYGALSLHSATPFTAQTVSFWIEGEGTHLELMLEADGEGYASPSIPLPTGIHEGAWTRVDVDVSSLGSHAWTRIDIFNNWADPASFHVDDLSISDTPVSVDGWTAAEPLSSTTVMFYGAGDEAELSLSGDGVARTLVSSVVLSDPPRIKTVWSPDFGDATTLTVSAGTQSFTRTLRAQTLGLGGTSGAISPDIYGMAFPEDAAYVAAQGVTVARWGGNATSLYNPATVTTNLANDWYFENYASTSAEDWLDEMSGIHTFLSVPALDWVAKDDTSCAYPVSTFGAQTSTDPWRSDCGNGTLTDGTEITWNDPATHATPWTPEMAAEWVGALTPTYIAIDNELDIASSTHRDVHAEPVTYDELFTRWTRFADAIRVVQPDAQIVGPSSCCWWFYWNSEAGEADKTSHGTDFLPWWLDAVAAHDAATGVRTLDVFDVHYYPDGVFNNDTDEATRAHRLRASRSLWDPTYTDESWIGTDVWATIDQPNPNEVQLIPRMKALIDAHYPGTRLGITEWNFGAEEDMSGGLAVADVLGIFGREGVDVATYWTMPASGTPAAAAFQLYDGFGPTALSVGTFDPDALGVYAATDGDTVTLVVVNKDPDVDVVFDVAEAYSMAHFSDPTGRVRAEDGALDGRIIVPAYSAALLTLDGGEDTGGPGDTAVDSGDTGGDSGQDSGDDSADDSGEGGKSDTGAPEDAAAGCGCTTTAAPSGAALLPLLLAGLRRGGRRRRDMLAA